MWGPRWRSRRTAQNPTAKSGSSSTASTMGISTSTANHLLQVITQTLLVTIPLLSSCVEPTQGFQVALPTDIINVGVAFAHHHANRHNSSPSRLFTASSSKISMENGDASPVTAIDRTSKAEIRSIADHLAKQTLGSMLSASEAKSIFKELLFHKDSKSTTFNDNSYKQYVKYWKKVEAYLREEGERTLTDILGRELTDRIISSIRGDGSTYDAQTVLAFLESDAVNSLFARLLYDAIFEFTTKFDILGNAISNLPLLGPVRNQVLKESKRNMDRTLGPLLQRFLSGYTRVAIRQAVDFVVSEENASAFGKANARLVSYLLEKRTVAEWIPKEKLLAEWREEVWSYLVGLEEGGDGGSMKVEEGQKKVVYQSIDWMYDIVGDKCMEDGGVDVNEILDASPTLERSLVSLWERCREASKTE